MKKKKKKECFRYTLAISDQKLLLYLRKNPQILTHMGDDEPCSAVSRRATGTSVSTAVLTSSQSM